MSTSPAKESLFTAANLLVFALLGTAVLASTYLLTRERIVQSEEAEKLKLITQIVPPALFDNDIIKDALPLPATRQLGTDEETLAYRGRLHGKPSVVVLQSVAPDGYSGRISLIVAIRSDATVAGVRVVAHKETPGLGDYIEYAKSRWIAAFDGASHARIPEDGWKVRKDGGQFDYMTGATISPRAVVKAVHRTLHYFEENRERLFAPANALAPEGKS